MSLFPAYAAQAEEPQAAGSSEIQAEWLNNSSFEPRLIRLPSSELSSHSDVDEKAPLPRKRKKTKKKRKKEEKPVIESSEAPSLTSESFTLDTAPIREYLGVPTISRPAVSKYRTKYYLGGSPKHKKRKFKRYFKAVRIKIKQDESDNDNGETLTKANLDKVGKGERDENFTGFAQEEELSKTTAVYNKHLAESPHDIEMWLKYASFQDSVYNFEKSYRKGSIVKAQRVLAERKIAILDKALTHNPTSEKLLRERLMVAVEAFPADDLQAQLKKWLEKEKENIILWQGYIEATQCSMSHCNSPAVLALYSKCLSTLHQLRRATITEKYIFEESILRMLYQCGLFLKQAGLFEQLWTLLKMYLEINLSPTDKERFNVERYVSEQELLELEEVVLTSQLPHHELWLRTEKLRESCHWLPFKSDQDCIDPQRIVFTEDIVELIHPITTPENIFKLVATTLTLLKIPLLPCRHSTMQDLGLDYVPWSLDSVEAMLPVFLDCYTLNLSNENLLKDTSRLAVGPQYLKNLPGQEQYMTFVLSIMENCAECLTGNDQIAVRVWWFRFLRMLIVLDNQGRFKMPARLKKSIKSTVKDLLKREEHRNNEIFYVEYALIEKAWGNQAQCLKILKMALAMNKNTFISTTNWTQGQINQCFLYRHLIEENLSEKRTVLNLLVELALQRKFDILTNGLIMEAETRFRTVTMGLLDTDLSELSAVEHFVPDFFTDWVMCNGWFLLVTKGPLKSSEFVEDILTKLEEKPGHFNFQREILHEFHCAILFKYSLEHSSAFGVLEESLVKSIEKFPNNLSLLAMLGKEQTLVRSRGPSAWKVENSLLKTNRAIPTIFAIMLKDLLTQEMEKELCDSISARNKMYSLFKKITRHSMCTRRCGLAWRLYLQFVYGCFEAKICRNVYYRAVEECPWLKALYMDAAVYIPAELPQIQDLIIEKQLRLHMTPEELDILRT